VDSGFQQLPHRDGRHGVDLLVRFVPPRASSSGTVAFGHRHHPERDDPRVSSTRGVGALRISKPAESSTGSAIGRDTWRLIGHDHDVSMDDGRSTPARTAAQRAGDAAETLVAERLEAAGWTILARNVHVGRHEIDLVAVDPGPPTALVIIEVRWRSSRAFGLPEETVDHRKRTRVRAAAYGLLDRGELATGEVLPRSPLRFDLVVVEPAAGDPGLARIRHHRAAF